MCRGTYDIRVKQIPRATAIATDTSSSKALALRSSNISNEISFKKMEDSYMLAAFIRITWAPKAALLNIAGSKRKGRYTSGNRVSLLARRSFFDPWQRGCCWLWSWCGSCHDASEDWEDDSGELEELHGEVDC